METHGERLGERELAERDVAADRVALALAHDEIFLEHALHVRKLARAAKKSHVRAQLLAALAAVVAATAGVRRGYRDLVAHPDAGHARADGGDHGGRLVARD